MRFLLKKTLQGAKKTEKLVSGRNRSMGFSGLDGSIRESSYEVFKTGARAENPIAKLYIGVSFAVLILFSSEGPLNLRNFQAFDFLSSLLASLAPGIVSQ